MATAPTSPNGTQTRTSSLRRLSSAVKRRKARVGEQTTTGKNAGARTQTVADRRAGAEPQPVPTIGKAQTGAKLKQGATGPDTGTGQKPGIIGDAAFAGPQTADPFRAAGTTPEGLQVYRSESGRTVFRDAEGNLRPYTGQTVAEAPDPGEFTGEVDPETGEAVAPEIGEFGAKSLKSLEDLAGAEVTAAGEALQKTETAITGREADTETQLAEGRERLDTTVRAADAIAGQAKEDASQLPKQVQDALSGIADKYKETTDVDIDRIEGLGREAVGMALEGKNAAAQAAVSAQQQAMRNAEAKINADPNIPPGRKSALLAQLRVNGSMQIATTIGANIKDFTQLQTGAMVNTMNAVASASTARNQSLAAMGGAEIQAVSGAYMKAADISAGFDELRINARNNADSIRFNYDNLTANYRDAKDGTSLALLDSENYVSQLPYDFALNHYAIGKDILGTDFATKLQAGGYNNMQEALAAGEEWARAATMSQLLMQMIPGPLGAILGGGTMLFGGGLK